MRKVIMLFATLFLVGCSKGIEDVKMGMSQEEVIDIIGEPDSIGNDYFSTQSVITRLNDNYFWAIKDEENRFNNDEEFADKARNIMGKMENLETKYENGEYIESHLYRNEDDVPIYFYYVNDELFVINDVHNEFTDN